MQLGVRREKLLLQEERRMQGVERKMPSQKVEK